MAMSVQTAPTSPGFKTVLVQAPNGQDVPVRVQAQIDQNTPVVGLPSVASLQGVGDGVKFLPPRQIAHNLTTPVSSQSYAKQATSTHLGPMVSEQRSESASVDMKSSSSGLLDQPRIPSGGIDQLQNTHSLRVTGPSKGSVGAYCCVPGCTNSRGGCKRKGLKMSFHCFPKDEKQKKIWLSNIGRYDNDDNGKAVLFQPKSHSRVCSAHFEGGFKSRKPEDANFFPSIFSRNSSQICRTKRAQTSGPLGEDSLFKRKSVPDSSSEPSRSKVQRVLQFPDSVWEPMTM